MSDNFVKYCIVLPLVLGLGLATTGCYLGQKGDLYLPKEETGQTGQTGQQPTATKSK